MNRITICLILALVSLILTACREDRNPPPHYYLTSNYILVEYNYRTTSLYQSRQIIDIDSGYIFPDSLLEKDQYLYAATFSRSAYRSQLLRFNPNLADPGTEFLYRTSGAYRLSPNIFVYKDTIAAVEKNTAQGDYYLVLVQPANKTIKKLKITEKVERKRIKPVVFGAGATGEERFWLVYTGFAGHWSIFTLWEKGKCTPLGFSEIIPVYIHPLLIHGDSKTVVFSKITVDGAEDIKRLTAPGGFITFIAGGKDLEQRPSAGIYGVISSAPGAPGGEKLLALDLKTLEFHNIPGGEAIVKGPGYFHYAHPDTWYYVPITVANRGGGPGTIDRLYRLEGRTIRLVKEFSPLDLRDKENYFNLYGAGIVLKRKGKIRVYRWADLVVPNPPPVYVPGR